MTDAVILTRKEYDKLVAKAAGKKPDAPKKKVVKKPTK